MLPGNFLLCEDSIIYIEDTKSLLEVVADNYDVDIPTLIDAILAQKVGVTIEMPLVFKEQSTLVDEKTLAPYCSLECKQLTQTKFILINPNFSQKILEEFWVGEDNV